MGTSSSSGGPSGKSNLLPTWYDENTDPILIVQPPNADTAITPENDGQVADGNIVAPVAPINPPSGTWGDAKDAFTRYTRNTRASSIGKASKNYLKALGGSSGATRSASKGISSGLGLVNFLGSVSSPGIGLNQSLTDLGLSAYIGRSSGETLAKIADAIAPAGSTNDEAVARDAILSTLDHLYTKILDSGGDLSSLESLSPDMIKETVIDYVSTYIFKKWLYELGLAVEKNTVTEKQAIAMEIEIKDFIGAEVKLSLQGKHIKEFSLDATANQQIIETIFKTAYSILE